MHTNGRMPKHQVCVIFEAPDSLKVASLEPKDLPGWDDSDMVASRKAGDDWLEKAATAALRVPSVVFDAERNVLINPEHAGFQAHQARRRRTRALGRAPVHGKAAFLASATADSTIIAPPRIPGFRWSP